MFKNAKEFVQYANKLKTLREKKLNGVSIYVCVGTGCTAKGALKVYSAFEEELKKRNSSDRSRWKRSMMTKSR